LLFSNAKVNKYLIDQDSLDIEYRYKYVYKMIKKVLFIYGIKISSNDFSNVMSTPSLFIANHKSSFDPLILFVILYEKKQGYYFQFVAKKELNLDSRIYNIFKLVDTIFIDRFNLRSTYEIYNNNLNISANKKSIVLFIEGTRIYDVNKIGEWHSGSLKVAYNSFSPIVPIIIYGSSGLSKSDNDRSYYDKKKHVYVKCLDPIKSNSYLTINPCKLSDSLRNKFIDEYNQIQKKIISHSHGKENMVFD
jgi:1-acyl-sn-glycerol-3-phosphate acyltransferase